MTEKLYPISVEVNGVKRTGQIPARLTLVDWLRDELRKQDFEGTQVLLAQLLAGGSPGGEIGFYQGELYRLRAGEDVGQTVAADVADPGDRLDVPSDRPFPQLLAVVAREDRDEAPASARRMDSSAASFFRE